jgi:hypothetical protein
MLGSQAAGRRGRAAAGLGGKFVYHKSKVRRKTDPPVRKSAHKWACFLLRGVSAYSQKKALSRRVFLILRPAD